MKKLSIILFILIGVVLISPNFIGGVVEKEHQSAVSKLNENPAVSIKTTTFTRDWFDGKATTEMTILLQDEGIEDITLIIEENLSFGPVIFTDEGVEFALSYSKADINFKEFLIDEEIETFINDKIHLSALLTFSKNISSKIVVDEVSKKVDGNSIVSAQAIGYFTLENNNRFYGDFNWAGLTAKSADESFIIDKVKFSVDQTLIAGDYYQGNAISTGDFDFSIASVSASDATGNEVLSLVNMLLKADSAVTNDLMTITMSYKADKIDSIGQSLEDANLDIIFNGLNINVMQEVNSLMAGLSTDEEETFTPEVMEELSLLASKLIADDPTLQIKDFSVTTPEGKIESSLNVNVDKALFNQANIMSIIPAINANANGKGPMPFFVKLGLAPMVDMYVQQGLIMLNEEELSFQANFSQGQLNINGQDIPL